MVLNGSETVDGWNGWNGRKRCVRVHDMQAWKVCSVMLVLKARRRGKTVRFRNGVVNVENL